MADALPALVAYIDGEQRFGFANHTYHAWFGVDPVRLVGQHVRDLLGELQYASVRAHLERALSGEPVRHEAELALPDGRVLFVESHYVPDRDEHGRTRGVVAHVHDVSERRRAELRAAAEGERLREVLARAPVSISVRSGPEHVYTLVNPLYDSLLGRRALLGRSAREALPEPAYTQFLGLLDRVYATGETVSRTEAPAHVVRGDGTPDERIFNVTYQALRDAEGRIDSVVSYAIDVSEQVKARDRAEELAAALQESEARYRDFVGRSTEGIWRYELEEPVPVDAPVEAQIEAFFRGAYLAECNDAMARMYGFERAEELHGKRLSELLIADDRRNREFLAAFIHHGYRLDDAESHELDRDGGLRIFKNSLVGTVEGGRLLRAWGTQRDVTAELEARQQAESANRAKDEFLAILGHELRNPLSPILTAIELMKLRDASGFQKERAIIERQVRHVVRLVNDLLDVAGITRGKIKLERQPLDLADPIAAAVELARPLLEQHAHVLRVEVPRGLTVVGDPTRLAQVFTNLLTNAAKYTPHGGEITIEAERAGERARVRVRDTGVGIRPELLARIFELFVQEHQELDRAGGGLGLGLPIVRSLVHLHGGTVEARSEGPGRGSEFTVYLPLSAEAPASARKPERMPALVVDWRVLIVDDNRDAADLLAFAFMDFGCAVRVAHDAPAALRAVEGFTPDLALLDIGLPVMNGYELARRLRAMSGLAGMKMVAVTGYGQEKDRAAAEAAGFDAHVVKPVNLAELRALAIRLMSSRPAPAGR